MPGPAPKPTVLKALNGNAGKRPLNLNEPKPDLGEPDMPTGMPAAAKKEWRRIVPILLKMGVLTLADGAALEAYCQSYATWRAALKEIRKNGLTYESGGTPITETVNGETKTRLVGTIRRLNPAVAERDKAVKVMRSFMTEFGMTPSSRSRIKAEPAKKEDAFAAKFLKTPQGRFSAAN